jgi:formate/nitrite transporter FocA (FNT family)
VNDPNDASPKASTATADAADQLAVVGVSAKEAADIHELSPPRSPVIYEVIRRQGELEMRRPVSSLWWSGVAAGLSISFSLLAEAVLLVHLPDTQWRPLLVAMGYPVGFLMVILSRQQLFTENTITVVLPVMKEFSAASLFRLSRLWTVVFCANMCGTLLAALYCSVTPVLEPSIKEAMLEISRLMMENTIPQMFFKAIASGFLIAAMVWLLPSADVAKFQAIALMTYLIAACNFTHIVAGSAEAFLLVVNSELSVGALMEHFLLPVLAGNIVGGTALFALLSYAQVMNEI